MSARSLLLAPTVVMGETRSSLLCHHSSDGTVVVGYSFIATEGFRPLIQRSFVVVRLGTHDAGVAARDSITLPMARVGADGHKRRLFCLR
jgi:hypothetical protein